MAFDELREDYQGAALHKKNCAADPRAQFQAWFDEAVQAEIPMANAMTLATVDGQGAPHARIVLLKELSDEGFVFFTNYQSDKGQELAAHAKAALVFWWHPHTRQVRIEGQVHKVSAAESDAYFDSRPRASNLVAMASAQSRAVESRAAMEEVIAAEVRRAGQAPITRPAHWGGYCVRPTRYEFWQGRPDRSHDRLVYSQDASQVWTITRLFP